MHEARIMVTLNHPCIVKLIGVSLGKPMMLVTIEALNVLYFIFHPSLFSILNLLSSPSSDPRASTTRESGKLSQSL